VGDVTSRCGATLTRALQEFGFSIDSVFEQLGATVVFVDANGRIRWQNTVSMERVGDRRGTYFLDVIAPEHREMAQTEFLRLKFDPVTSSRREVVVIGPDGTRKRTLALSVPVATEDATAGIVSVGIPLNSKDDVLEAPQLSTRLVETLELLTAGRSTPEIAAELGVAVETARNHIRRLFKALGVHSRVEAVARGRVLRLVGSEPDSSHDPT
jgi:ATP/maltotriose-dependent transcriptional regulator MalT